MTKERRLGRGLEALLGIPSGGGGVGQHPQPLPGQEPVGSSTQEPGQTLAGAADGLVRLNVYEIDTNPYQPRTEFDEAELAELAESLKAHGLMQPVVVRRQGDRFQLIAGERRWRAAIRAGWSQVPALVREADDRQVAELTIVENLQRRDLGPLEKAASFQKYLEKFQCTQEELAGRLSIDRSTVANLIRLLELPEAVRDALRLHKITAGHARALLPLGEERDQMAFCQRIQDEQLSVRATEQLVSDTLHAADGEPLGIFTGDDGPPAGRSRRSSHLGSLEQEFRTALGTKVDVKQSAKGRGRITIHFTSPEEFDRLRALLTGHSPQQQVRVG